MEARAVAGYGGGGNPKALGVAEAAEPKGSAARRGGRDQKPEGGDGLSLMPLSASGGGALRRPEEGAQRTRKVRNPEGSSTARRDGAS